MGRHVYISHARGDERVALELRLALYVEAVETWSPDQDLRPGEDFSARIAERISTAGAFVLILSRQTLTSRFVDAELEQAESGGIPVFILRIDDAEIPALQRSYRYADASAEPTSYEIFRFVDLILNGGTELRDREQFASATPTLDSRTMERLAGRNREFAEQEAISEILKQSFRPSSPPATRAPEAASPRRPSLGERLRNQRDFEPRSMPPPSAAPPPPPSMEAPRSAQSGASKVVWGVALGVALAVAYKFRHEAADAALWLLQALKLGAAPAPPAAPSGPDEVDVSAFAPTRAQRGASFFVQAFVHRTEASARSIARLAAEADPDARRRAVATLALEIGHKERLDFVLEGEGLVIEEPQHSLIWRGQPRGCAFLVHAPAGFQAASANLRLRVLLNAMPVGSVGFSVSIDDHKAAAPIEIAGTAASRYRRAFLSYASSDRAEVLKRAQMLTAARIEYFQDLQSLEPGERFEERIFDEIGRADLFLLFWSQAAKTSKWVMREVDCAIEGQKSNGRPAEIVPVILEGPPPPKPPDSLEHLHFDDKLLYLIAAIDRLNAERPAQ